MVSSSISVGADFSTSWDSDSDWTSGATYENARVNNGSVDIGLYPPEPDFSGSDWSFSTSTITEVDELKAERYSGQAYFYSYDDYDPGEAYGYATNTFYIDTTGVSSSTLTFWWKAYASDFDSEDPDSTTTLKILLQKPTGSWYELWSETKTAPWESTDTNTESVDISAYLTQSGNYTIKIQAYWYFTSGWFNPEGFKWYVDDITLGITEATHTTSWKDIGTTSAWQTLDAGASIDYGQSITAKVQVSDDQSTVKGTKTVSLLNGTNSYSVSTLPAARYVRVITDFDTPVTSKQQSSGYFITSTPRLDNYEVTADPIPTLASGGVDPENGPLYTTFTFTVTYTDYDGDEPSYVKVYINRIGYGSTGYDMTKITGTYTSGATYHFLTATLSVGSYEHYFVASDGTTTVYYPSGAPSVKLDGPTVGLTPTTLSVSPSSFSVSSGGTKTLTATLTVNGSPLANKTITWTKTAGSLSATSGTTNSSGQVPVTYTAPTVSTSTGVTVSASFAGDSQYGSSSDSSSGTVSPTTPPTFEVTITFRKPDGSPLANTTIYYGTSKGQETSYLGVTDSQGKITSTNSALAGDTIYFKSSDGRYTGSTYVSSSGGSTSASLTEAAAEDVGFPWAIVAVLLIVGGLAGGWVLAWKKGLLKPKPVKRKLERKVKPSKPAPIKPVGRFCSHCKLKLPADAEFCPECGRKVKR